jgi:osmoprotectant transport system ATP-binding protein
VTESTGAPVDIRGVVVSYPNADRRAVDDVSLEVAGGEFVVLLGPSGCGKSTLLRTINRLVIPEAGTILVDGRDVRDETPEALRRGIGYVIQAVGLFPHMSVGRNIGVVPELLGWDKPRVAARVDELLALVQLDPARYRGRMPRELSGGEQQRVGVARALAAEPRVLLMDEPFGAVDAIVRTALQDETLRIHRALGTTIFFVTHDVDEALRLADRIVVMNAGKIVQADAPLHVLAKPASPYVEELMDTKDAVRRLQLMRVRDAMAPPGGTTQGRIGTERSLREALTSFLEGADRLAVMDGDLERGTLGFDDVRRAIAAGER